MKKDTEYELLNMVSLHTTLSALRDSMREGTLGRHLPRMFAPRRLVAEAGPALQNIITLAGIKDGKALFEIRSAPGGALEKSIAGEPYPKTQFRYDIGLSFIDKPWLRALVPLTGTLNGSAIQLRQPHAFNPYDVGFIANNGGDRRGIASRHFTSWSLNNGSAHYYLPSIRAALSSKGHYDGHFAIPVDSYLNVRLESFDQSMTPVPIVHGPLLKGSTRLAADRIARRKMRDSAHDVLARVSAALAMLDMPKSIEGSLPIAVALQDMLGMTNHHPDFNFLVECESSTGRDLGPWTTMESYFIAAVVAGAVHTGTRTPLYHDNDAIVFIRALQAFKPSLDLYEDKVFQANTLFSSAPELSPSGGDYDQLRVLPNLTII